MLRRQHCDCWSPMVDSGGHEMVQEWIQMGDDLKSLVSIMN